MERTFFTSSHSGTQSDACVAVSKPVVGYGPRTSSYSGPNGGQCLEVAADPAWVAVRDSKYGEEVGPVVVTSPEAFTAFLGSLTAEYARVEI